MGSRIGGSRSGTKLCVDDASSGTTDGNKIDLYTCNGTGAQQWTIGTDGTARVLGKCLDVSGGGTTNSTKTVLYTCNGSAGQQWKAGANGSLVNTASGKCLDDPSSSTTNGTQLQIYTCNASSAQRWTNVTMGNVLPGATQSFAYDAEGRTASVTTPSGGKDQTTSYLYDAGGSLLLQTTPTSKILYLFGGAEQLTLSTSAGTVSGLRYYSGPDGVTEVRSSDGTLTYKVSNAQGTSTTEIAASNLAVTRRYFDPYGSPRGPQPTSWADNHGYLGKPTDATTGLDLLGARNYDPVQGRFLTADPLMEAGDPNQMSGYSYAADNPASSSDPTGLDDWWRDPSMNKCVIDCGSSGTDNSSGGTGGGGTTSSSGDTTAAPPAAPACNAASKFGCDVSNAQQMAQHGPPTSGRVRDFLAGMLDEALQQLEQLSPGGAMMNSAHDLANGMAPGIVGPPAYVAPRHAVAHALHAHTNTDVYKAGKATTVILEVAASGGDAPEGAVAAIADARDAQDGLAAAAEVKNVVSETTEEATATAANHSDPGTGASGSGVAQQVPQGLTAAEFADAAQTVRAGAGHLGDNIVVQGSRASGTARPDSDLDLAIRVSPDRFDELVSQRFGTPNPGSAKERTMLWAVKTGKIQAGEAGVSGVRRALEAQLGMDVDLSVIRQGGPFDNPPFIEVPDNG